MNRGPPVQAAPPVSRQSEAPPVMKKVIDDHFNFNAPAPNLSNHFENAFEQKP